MARAEPKFLVVGHIAKPHGTKGELMIQPLTDHPGDVFVPGAVLRAGHEGGAGPHSELSPLRIDAARPFRKGWLVSFLGINDRNAAELVRGWYVLIERSRLPPLAQDEVFVHDLIGLEVLTVDGRRVGEVIEVYEVLPANLLEVRTEGGSVLVPFLETLVREVDVEGGRLVIDPPEGLLE